MTDFDAIWAAQGVTNMSKQEKITPQEAVEAFYGLIRMIDKDQLVKLNKLDGINGLENRLAQVERGLQNLESVLAKPVKINDPILVEEGQISRNNCIQSSCLYSEGFYKILKKMVENVAGIMSDVMDIKAQLDEMRKPWWRKVWNAYHTKISK